MTVSLVKQYATIHQTQSTQERGGAYQVLACRCLTSPDTASVWRRKLRQTTQSNTNSPRCGWNNAAPATARARGLGNGCLYTRPKSIELVTWQWVSKKIWQTLTRWDPFRGELGVVVYNGELWLYQLKYGARPNLHEMGGDYHELHGSVVAAQHHTDLVHSLSMLSQHRLSSRCQ